MTRREQLAFKARATRTKVFRKNAVKREIAILDLERAITYETRAHLNLKALRKKVGEFYNIGAL